jgi:hypothetical protein
MSKMEIVAIPLSFVVNARRSPSGDDLSQP